MPYPCSYRFCPHKGAPMPDEAAYACARCDNGKAMHKACWEKHAKEKHGGKATCEPLVPRASVMGTHSNDGEMDKLTIRVIRNGLKFPYRGFCVPDTGGDPYLLHLKDDAESCWHLLETKLRKRRDALKAEGWKVVQVDLPDADDAR